MDLAEFIDKWSKSSAAERANKDHFLLDLCDAIDVPRPSVTTGDPAHDLYVFERDAMIVDAGEKKTVGKIDLYKDGCFLLEAKQGSNPGSAKLGTARRGTPGWTIAMRNAYGQGLSYARTIDRPPPFLLVCDIGECFDLYAAFDRTWDYRPFPNAQTNRLFLSDLPKHRETLRAIFLDPDSLDPARRSSRVTKEVAGHIAELAKELEAVGHESEMVAAFLMRCLFTMFAEDVGLLPEQLFTRTLEAHWIPKPETFASGVMNLWAAMNEGGWSATGKLLRFNGGLFADQKPLPLSKRQLERLLEAARCSWGDVEPAIFGTLIERALDPRERHALGAHYTPRAYVERLVKPTIEEPLRAEWAVVQAEARQLVERGKDDSAAKAVRTFHERLCKIRVLDPACGSGNFLYVTLDLFKRLESEVLGLLSELSHAPLLSQAQNVTVTPAQFLGIEIKPWAKEIAELVLWIGFLQWHHRTHGNVAPKEPVLRDYKNIERRDAVLAYDREEIALDDDGKPITRWDGRTMKKSPVTGEDIPDEAARVPLMQFVNPRKAVWPDADFIVGNPPFVGNKRMRAALGDGYVEALRAAHDDVPETSDFVMYFWNHAAELVRAGMVRRFGLITTNSITQTFNRKVVERHLDADPQLCIVFAIADHPWVDSADGASVRIAMTVGDAYVQSGLLYCIANEEDVGSGEHCVTLSPIVGKLNADLSVGVELASLVRLRSNRTLSCPGVQLSGQGFVLSRDEAAGLSERTRNALIRPYVTGRDITQRQREQYVIDPFGLTEERLRDEFPDAYQRLLERVKPERDHNPREKYRREWWLHSESRARFRRALSGTRYIATSRTARHRTFQFLPHAVLAETKVLVIALGDGVHLGVLSSRAHVAFANRQGGWLGVGNDSTYNHSNCFDPFPFPDPTESQSARIRDLGEALDAHRKRQQALHPKLTITGMYNVLEKLRAGEKLTAKEQKIHEQGLVSVLKQIHDDLDAAVFDAYGWPRDLTDEQILERLVALNAERAAEEKRGLVRWLRPEFQNPSGATAAQQTDLAVAPVATAGKATKAKLPKWPSKLPEQIAGVRSVVLRGDVSWSVEEVAREFQGARRDAVEAVLESLAALGLVLAYESGGTRRWKAPIRSAA
ncbi:MAG: SAM-dependent methyltransferase [Proteobacteria bacterium]|nr:MAG: SAM-dependent methyltransferase [Pseudomonadota bacterium]